MLRTANIISVPTPFACVNGNTFSRATWCIRLNANIAVSHGVSCDARFSISASWSLGDVSVMPRKRNLPFSFSRSSAGAISCRTYS